MDPIDFKRVPGFRRLLHPCTSSGCIIRNQTALGHRMIIVLEMARSRQ